MSRAIATLVIVSMLGGCASMPTASGKVTHVVVCWLKKPGDAVDRQKLIDRSKMLAQIPGVKRVVVGPTLPSMRPVVDASFDIALVITFEDERALREYDSHPIHQQAVKEVLMPLVAKFVIYDFENE